jgi:hypothetical protein
MTFDYKAQERARTERLRGWIIYLIYKTRPNHLELDTLMRLLDSRNLPVTRRRLAGEVDYLRGLRLLEISLGSAQPNLDESRQARLIQRYADADRDEVDAVCATLTAAGINFHEGFEQTLMGIARVE